MIGIEAITDAGLAEIGKRQRVTMIEKAIHAFHDHHIAVHGMFIAGLDSDTAGSAEAIASFARRLHIDTFQLMVETPLPGTRLWDRIVEEDRLLSDDWSLFDGHHVVMQPAQMTPLELQLGVLKAMRRFYSWPTILNGGLVGVLRHLPSFTAAARPAFIRRLPVLARAAWAQPLGRRGADAAGGPVREGPRPGEFGDVVAGAPLLRPTPDRGLVRGRTAPGRTSRSSPTGR